MTPLADEERLYTTRQYPCGCKAEGPGDVPDYCSEHGLPPSLCDPVKSMERGGMLLTLLDQRNAAWDALRRILGWREIDRNTLGERLLAIEEIASAALAGSRDETNGDGWIACSERMPAHGLKVMAFFRNKLGKGRTVFAHHFEKLKERADNYEIDYDTPDDWFDTDESGESYIPEGWYENSETHEQELKIGDEILFWRPMLASPEKTERDEAASPLTSRSFPVPDETLDRRKP